MRRQYHTALLATGAVLGAVLAAPAIAKTDPQAPAAQPAPQTDSAAPPEGQTAAPADTNSEVLVTARRRNENIVDVPLAITVVGSEKIERLNLTSTRDIANFVPGLEFSDFTQGNSRNDRGGNRTIIFRGLNLANNGGGVQQAASMFLDGAAVLGNEIPAGLDVGAVEILRGPQNVYFGRSTMTGAIAYRTKPIPQTMGINANIELAERGTVRFESSIAGPLIPDVLGFRVTGLYERNDGYITNAYDPSGPRLGARSRRSLSGALNFTPTQSLEVKLYGNYFADEDGASATVNIFPDALPATSTTVGGVTTITPPLTGRITNCVRGQNATLNGATTLARATICGEVPGISNAIAYSRTDIPGEYARFLFDYTPYVAAEHFKHMAGLQRHVFNSHAVVNFQLSDYLKAQSITGYHVTTVVQDIDGGAQPIQPSSPFSILFFGLANKYKDFSQELRLSSDPERAFSWTAGANYVNARSINQAWNLFTTNTQPTAANPTPVQTFNGASGVFNPGDNRATTYGFFAGGYLKLFDNKLTLSAEGRYQIDDRFTQTLNAATMAVVTTSPILDTKFHAFYPRVSVDYDVGNGRKVYASYARGGRPGGFNATLLSFFDPNNSRYATCGCYAATIARISSLFGVTSPAYEQESLDIGELGFKGYLPDGRGYFDFNAYYGRVSNQQVTQAQIIDTLTPPTTLSIITNTGKTEIYGLEFTGNYNFTPDISLDTTFAWNHTRRLTYIDTAPGDIALYGRTDYSGLKLPLAPLITGSAILSYEEARSDNWSPFANTALVYRGKQYADLGNLAYIPGRAVVDLRVGAKNDRLRIEGFVTNLFQNRTYPGGNVAPDFGINTVNGIRSQYSGFFGAYAEPRTVGVRISAGL